MSAAAARSRVLVVEDEPMLRTSVVAGLARLKGVEVVAAGSVAEAVESLAAGAPDVVLSDIDLPDRPGIELLGELGARGLQPYVVFVSAYLKAFRAWIPRSAHVEVLEKPVSLEVLRRIVLERVPHPDQGSPFSVADYLQIASLGHHSVELEVRKGARQGRVVVSQGEAWAAADDDGEGSPAFARILAWEHPEVRCLALREGTGARNLSGSVEALLLDAVRLQDEARAAAPAAPPAAPPPTPDASAFTAAWERGVQATLRRDYQAAYDAFLEAQALSPEDKKVLANLQRLQTLLKKDG